MKWKARYMSERYGRNINYFCSVFFYKWIYSFSWSHDFDAVWNSTVTFFISSVIWSNAKDIRDIVWNADYIFYLIYQLKDISNIFYRGRLISLEAWQKSVYIQTENDLELDVFKWILSTCVGLSNSILFDAICSCNNKKINMILKSNIIFVKIPNKVMIIFCIKTA
jgi:hypothetical protein